MKLPLILVLAFFIFSCSNQQNKKRSDILFADAKEEILNRLKSPSTANFIDEKNNIIRMRDDSLAFRVRVSVDAQNSFGADIRNRYTLIYKQIGSDSLNIDSYKMVNFID